jgi:hypothetical protein
MLRFATKPPKKLYDLKLFGHYGHGHGTIHLVEHLGRLALVEDKPITIAVVDPYDDLTKATVLNPRYATNVPHRLVNIWGCRMSGCNQGRILDALTEEPFEVKGQEYGILGFKGTGRDADGKDMVLHPTHWYDGTKRWDYCPNGDHHGRRWGFVLKRAGLDEMADRVLDKMLAEFKIPVTPYLNMNPLANRVLEAIVKEHGERGGDLDLLRAEEPVQLTRALSTNIRMLFAARFFDSNINRIMEPYLNAEALATIDQAFVLMLIRLANNAKRLNSCGSFEDNRLFDGTLADTENLVIAPRDEISLPLVGAENLFYGANHCLAGQAWFAYIDIMRPFLAKLEKLGNGKTAALIKEIKDDFCLIFSTVLEGLQARRKTADSRVPNPA